MGDLAETFEIMYFAENPEKPETAMVSGFSWSHFLWVA